MSHRPLSRACPVPPGWILIGAVWLSGVAAVRQDPAQSPPPQRFFRHFTQDDGLPSGVIFALAQDTDGFLWIGTAGGLARYGGRDFVTVRADAFGGGVHHIATSLSGRLAVVERGRRELWLARDGDFAPVIGPDGALLRSIRSMAFDAGDTLWVIQEDGRLLRQSPAGDWFRADARAGHHGQILDGDVVDPRYDLAFGQLDGSLLLTTWEPEILRGSLWTWPAGHGLQKINVAGRISAAARTPGGEIWFAASEPHVSTTFRLRGEEMDTVATRSHRALSLLPRGDFVYMSTAVSLEMLTGDGSADPIPGPTGVPSGGSLFVDREGSLWMGTAVGLLQYPEPETSSWGSEHGLTGSSAEFIAASPTGVWLSAWSGLGLLEAAGGNRWRGRNVQDDYASWAATRICVDGEGVLWLTGTLPAMSTGAVSSVSARTIQHHTPTPDPIDCDTREDGTVFIVADGAVHRTLPGARFERLGLLPSLLAERRPYVAGGTQGDIHLVRGDGPNDRDPYACDTSPAELKRHGPAAWRCARFPDVGQIRDVIAVPGPNGESELWLASFSGGVLHRVDGEWRPVDALRPMQQRATNALSRSPAGGIWVSGFGFVVRLAPVAGQWQIVEELSGWHGVEGDIRALWEEPDGTVWLASWRGATRVPPAARSRSPTPPSARLLALRVDGVTTPATDAVIPSDHRAVEIEFAAGALRDPHRARYRTRLDDVEWSETPEPVFRMARVPAGDHVIEVAASLDGLLWGEPYRLEFRVERAWYARAWVFATAAALLFALALIAHRLRTAHLVGLERQRTSIAMDLHDELGAGLGSLGILGGVVAQGTAPSSAQRQMGGVIARTAAELGESLHDIVYSLKTGEARVEHLAEQVVSRGRTLFAGNGVHFTARLAAPADNGGVAPSVSRHAYRIAVEALHNAARHANAAHIEVGLAANGTNGQLRLWVEDDGRGIDPDALSEPGGMGLITMRRRAEVIGGTLTIESPPGRGTRIALDFDPHGRREHRTWWRATRSRMQRGSGRRD